MRRPEYAILDRPPKRLVTTPRADAELASALASELRDGSLRIIPLGLEDTPLPILLQPISWINAEDEEAVGVARKIMGLNSSEQYIKAVQAEIGEADLEFAYFHGYGVAAGCPRCGSPVSDLEQWVATDYLRDDEYAGVRCKRCRWEDGGEKFDITKRQWGGRS